MFGIKQINKYCNCIVFLIQKTKASLNFDVFFFYIKHCFILEGLQKGIEKDYEEKVV